MRVRPLVPILATLAVGVAAPAQAETTIAETRAGTPITAYGGVTAWNDRDAEGDHVVVVRQGQEIRTLPIEPSLVPFDLDLGPGADGRPELVFTRCEGAPGRDCDVHRFDLAANAERPVRGVNTSGASEHDPTTWRGTIAFARTGARTTEIRVAGRGVARGLLPARKCFEDSDTGRRVCRRTTERRVDDLELGAGGRLAAVTYVGYRGVVGFGDSEVRLATVGRPGARQIAQTYIGLSGVYFGGLALDRGRLSFYRGCGGDPAGCQKGRAGVYRYRLATRTYDEAPGPKQAVGHAADGGLHRIVRCAQPDEDPAEDQGCRVVELDGARFAPVKPPR